MLGYTILRSSEEHFEQYNCVNELGKEAAIYEENCQLIFQHDNTRSRIARTIEKM